MFPDKASAPDAPSDAQTSSDSEATPAELGDHGKLGELPPDQTSQEEKVAADPKVQDANPNIMEIAVTDDKGRRTIKVDLNDREKLAKILPQAYGFRKALAERDTLKKQLDASSPRLQELESNWQTLEKSYQEGGVEGLVDLLGGKKGHYKEYMSAEIAKANKFAGATEAEKERILLEEKLTRMTKDSELREKRASEEAKKAVTEREAADLSRLESQIVPSFNKHRFAGTLGNEAQEKVLDQAIWDQAIRNLEGLPDNEPLTQELIDKEFRATATTFKAAIGKQANAKAKQVIDKTKQNAQVQMASAASRGIGRPSGLEQSMSANIKKGGLDGLTAGLMDVLRMGRK